MKGAAKSLKNETLQGLFVIYWRDRLSEYQLCIPVKVRQTPAVRDWSLLLFFWQALPCKKQLFFSAVSVPYKSVAWRFSVSPPVNLHHFWLHNGNNRCRFLPYTLSIPETWVVISQISHSGANYGKAKNELRSLQNQIINRYSLTDFKRRKLLFPLSGQWRTKMRQIAGKTEWLRSGRWLH